MYSVSAMALVWIIHDPTRKRGILCWSLAYASGYENNQPYLTTKTRVPMNPF